jgi:hypothetical protein
MKASPHGTYVYCVFASRRVPAVPRLTLRRLPGTGPVRLLEIRPGRFLVVGTAPLNRFGEDVIPERLSDLDWVARAAVAHEAVVESFLGVDALLPMRLLTIFTSDDRALHEVRENWPRIERDLRRLTQKVEWGIRLTLSDPPSTSGPVARRAPRPGTAIPPQSGRDYLRAKSRLRGVAGARLGAARRRTASVYKALASRATEAKRRPLAASPSDGGRLLLDAAFLVPVSSSSRFHDHARRLTSSLRAEGLNLQMTGPWPAYSFVRDA